MTTEEKAEKLSTADKDLFKLHQARSPKCPFVQKSFKENDVCVQRRGSLVQRSWTAYGKTDKKEIISQRKSLQHF